jgi:hypothetical protein
LSGKNTFSWFCFRPGKPLILVLTAALAGAWILFLFPFQIQAREPETPRVQVREQEKEQEQGRQEQGRVQEKEQKQGPGREQEQEKEKAKTRAEVKIPAKPETPEQTQAPAAPVKANEIITVSKLAKKNPEFTINRDIFSPDIIKPNAPGQGPPPQEFRPPQEQSEKKEDEKKTSKVLEDEIRNNLSYEGYVVKSSKNVALVNSNGEFYAVGVGDLVVEKIKIIKIEKEAITVEYDNNVFEIPLKGDEENEKNI